MSTTPDPHAPRPFTPAAGSDDTLDAVDRYINQHLGECEIVLHEIASQLVHVDVHICKPTPTSNAWTLITSGMSDRPMPRAADYKVPPHAELMLRLPPTWPAATRGVSNTENNALWPHNILRQLARMPHECNFAVGPFHTLCFTNPPSPLREDAPFVGVFLLPPIHLPTSAHTITTASGREIHLYSVHFLYQDELDHKIEHGIDPILDLFDEVKLSDILDINRKSILDSR